MAGDKISGEANDNGLTTYHYDPLGQLIEVDGPLPGTDDLVEIGYDEMGHKAWQDDPDKGYWEYRHNALGELVCQLDAKGQAIVMTYDGLGRKTDREERDGVSDLSNCTGTLRGVTAWTYGNLPLTPEFGQVRISTHEYFSDSASAYGWTEKRFFYDSLGRVEQVDTTIRDGQGAGQFERSYTEATTYDRYGRVFQAFDASGDGRGVRYHYNAHGYRHQLQEAQYGSAGPVYWEVTEMDARGQISAAVMGNGTIVTAEHDPVTGRLEDLVHDTGSDHALDLELEWDAIGRLFTRRDRAGHDPQGQVYDQTERFIYDDRNRIERIEHRTDTGSFTPVQRLNYDVAGNILCKSDVSTTTDCSSPQDQNYTYGGPRPHAVTSAGGTTYTYDANGNVISDGIGRSFAYTVSDRVRRISSGGMTHTEFHYGPDRQRTLRRDFVGESLQPDSRTHYVGSVEVILDGSHPAPDTGEYRRYIGGIAIAKYYAATGNSETRYLHKDHLGSITAISDEVGQVVTWMSFDAWGQRRDSASWHPWNEPPAQYLSAMLAITPRGFTGHEHIEHANIVHMNGRIYDPHLGRFLQADPYVEDSTTLNRYTYVHNNPLAYTDPSGFLSIGDVFKIAAVVAISVVTGFVAAAALAAKSYAAAYAIAAVGGAVAGAITTGTAEGALWGAFTAVVFTGIGQGIKNGPDWMHKVVDGNKQLTSSGIAVKTVSHGLAGGVISDLQGGKFGHGFFASGVTAAATPKISTLTDSDFINGAVAAMVGGTVSSATGGKFANGATTAAMAYAFNQVVSQERPDRGVCSDEACVGRARKKLEPGVVSGAGRLEWNGVESIEHWHDLAPPIGRGLRDRIMGGITGHYWGIEEGRYEYLQYERYERVQYLNNRVQGEFKTFSLPGKVEVGDSFWAPVDFDQRIPTRIRWKTCAGGACFHWPR